MSPPKGMLPLSADWFVTWLPNVHSSFFYNIYVGLLKGLAASASTPSLRLSTVRGADFTGRRGAGAGAYSCLDVGALF